MSQAPFILIPSRMESTRFPGKPLALIAGTPMIERVYRNAIKTESIGGCAICTDSQEIYEFCKKRKIEVIKTKTHHTGTDRVCEAAKQVNAELVINLQGDEPLIDSRFLSTASQFLMNCNRAGNQRDLIFSAYCSATYEEARCKNVVKCFINASEECVAFSRKEICSAINDGILCFYKQIGVYGYTIRALEEFSSLGYSQLEEAEKIELMRWIDHKGSIRMIRSRHPAYSVDTIEDLVKVEQLIVHQARGMLS